MPARVWEQVLDFKEGQTVDAWVDSRAEEIGLDRNFTWYYDQWITTYGVLKVKQ